MTDIDPFAQYKLPLGLSEGVKIPLTGTPATFTVLLPATMNEEFNLELMSRLSADIQDDGTVKVNAVKFQRERTAMFFDTCILSCEGLPDGVNASQFFKLYPLAKRALFDRAMELAEMADEEARESLEKLKSSPSGKTSGADVSSNTKTSSKAA